MIDFLKGLFKAREIPPDDVGRNDACWCGSGKKYKRCHYEKDLKVLAAQRSRDCRPSG